MNRKFDVNDFLKKAKEMGIEVEENVSEAEAGLFACGEGSKELKKVNVSELFDNEIDQVLVWDIHFNKMIENISIIFKEAVDEVCSESVKSLKITIEKMINIVDSKPIKASVSFQNMHCENISDLNFGNKFIVNDKKIIFSDDVKKSEDSISYAA